MRKNLFLYFISILLFLFCLNSQVFSEEAQDVSVSENTLEETDLECKDGVCNINPRQIAIDQQEKELQQFFDNYEKAYNSHNVKKILALHENDYVNSDGLNISQYAKLLQRTFDNFPDINTKVEVLDITPNTKYAIAYISEIKHATTKSESKITNDKGNFKSEEKKIIYLEEFNGIWKIYSDNIIEESSITSYGIGKDVSAELIVPQKVLTNSDYSAAVFVFAPEGHSAMASINNGQLSEDFVHKGSGYRSVNRNTGLLERMFKANCENNNEYVIASVGFSKVSSTMFKDSALDLKGLIMLMKRVNIIPNTKNVELQKVSESAK